MKLKSIIVYGIIIFLCIGAFVTNFILKKEDTPASSVNQTTSSKGDEKVGVTPINNGIKTAAGRIIATRESIVHLSEEEKNKHVQQLMYKASLKPESNPVVGIGQGTDFGKVTAAAIQNAGGLHPIVSQGDVVLIKPNLCIRMGPEAPFTTDYRVVQEIVDEVRKCGASRVVVAEGCFTGNVFDEIGLTDTKYELLEGVDFYNFNDCEKEDCYLLKPPKSLIGKELYIPKLYMDADVVINVAKLKTHFLTGVSLCLKNSIGVPSEKIYGSYGSKSGLHDLEIDRAMIDITKIRKPDFSIIDGIVGGEGDGPVNCTPVKSNVVFAGKDILSVDTVASNFMGFKTKEIPHLVLAEKEKLGITDINQMKIIGADLNSIKMEFQSLFNFDE